VSAEFRIDLNAFGRIKEELGKPLVTAAAKVVRNEIVSQMHPGPARTGRTYKVPATKQEYTASAPGQPPAEREGIYAGSWKSTDAIEQDGKVVAFAYSDLDPEADGTYLGLSLEHGTTRYTTPGPDSMIVPSVQHIAPRPHIGPGIAAARPQIEAMVKKASGR
jgi:hypothetical protein